jgi:hypothetical protein
MSGLVVDPLLQEYVVAPDAVNVADAPEQIASEFTVIVGVGLIVTEATPAPEQPAALLPVTVYEVLAVGETTIGFVVDPLLQEYVAAPLAVNVADPPEQIASEFTVMVGVRFTLTVPIAVPEHPAALLPVTV